MLVASSRCRISAMLPMESEIKRTLLLFEVGNRDDEDVCGVDEGVLVG